MKAWDIRPFAPADRHIRTFDGAQTGMERNLFKANWDSKGKTIAAGSGDRTVVIWDADSGKLLYKLPGHKGAVNDVVFSPSEEQIGKRYPCRVTILFGNADNFRYSFVWIV